MKKAGIIVNKSKREAYSYLALVVEWLERNGCVPIWDIHIAKYLKRGCGVSLSDVLKSSDFLIVLGGDGTILNIAADAAFYGIPILGINLGTLGYLTDADTLDGFNALQKVVNGEYQIERRMTLTAECTSYGGKHPLALNEFCVSKGVLSRMITFDLLLNDSYINTYRADGIIVATPTGSTAYNLSAGGPVLKPDGDMIALTPICPHDLFARCSVVSGTDIIKIKIISGGENDIILSADGKHIARMEHNDIVEIKASKYYVNIIKTNELSFFDVLRKKMS